MKSDNITELLIKFYSNTCTPEEYEEVMIWLSDPKNKDEANKIMEHHWSMLGGLAEQNSIDSNKVLGNIKKQIKGDAHRVEEKVSKKNYWYKIAAIITLVLGVSLFYGEYVKVGSESNEIKYITYLTGKSDRDSILLADNSLVILNFNSSLKVSEDYKSDRKLMLDGEAFFEVSENQSNPFVVEASNMLVTALGTSFNIKTTKSKSKVDLVTGKVKVQRKNSAAEVLLNPGEMAYLSIPEYQLYKGKTYKRLDLVWFKEVVIFEESDFDEVMSILQSYYGIEIDVPQEHSFKWRYTAKFKEQDISTVLDIMSYSLSFDYEIQGKHVSIF